MDHIRSGRPPPPGAASLSTTTRPRRCVHRQDPAPDRAGPRKDRIVGMNIQMSTQTPAMARARSVLMALATPAGWAGLPAAEAFFTLSDVVPPYPPAQPAEDEEAITLKDALVALHAAIEQTSDPEEIARIVEAADCLQHPVAGHR